MKKRIISILLCAVMVLCAIPLSVSATAVLPTEDTIAYTGAGLYNDVLKPSTNSTLKESQTSYTVKVNGSDLSMTRKNNSEWQWKTFTMDFAKVYTDLSAYQYVVVRAKSSNGSGFTLGTDTGANETAGYTIGTKANPMATDMWYTKVFDLTKITGCYSDKTTMKAAVGMITGTELTIGNFILCKTAEAAETAAEKLQAVTSHAIQINGQSVRFVATVDDLTAAKVGFEVVIKAGDVTKKFVVETTTVYTSVKAAEETVTAADLDGTYIFALVITDIPEGEATFTVTPFTDSSYGITKTATETISAPSGS